MTTVLPLPDARGEVIHAAELFRWFSEEAAPFGGVKQSGLRPRRRCAWRSR